MFINNLAYEASAGSGKTFMLVVRYLSLLFKGASPSKILALTFTNKAASEMQERIIQTLEELSKREGELSEISKITEFSKEYLLANRQRVLGEFLNSNTKIMTIDSFFTGILRKFSLYASLMPDFSTFSSQHELKLLSRFLKEVSVAGKKETLITLSLQSKKRLSDIFFLLDEFYVKFQELKHIEFHKEDHLRFENEAMFYMSELKKIVASNKNASFTAINAVNAQTFEDLCSKTWIGNETLNYRTFAKCFTLEMDKLLCKIQEAIKNQNRAKEQNFFFALKELVDLYAKSKKALYMDDGELSFNDVTYLVYEILRVIDDREFLYFRLDSQIEHMLLDEFQDTGIIQYEILKPLINEITSGSGIFDNGSFFFVGDVKQSIYRFRGGVSALFDAVREENSTHVEKLLTNYRSQKEIVEFVNSVFEHKIKNYTPQLSRDQSDRGFIEVIQNDEVLQEVADQVKRVLKEGADINEIAILCATNDDGEEIKNALCSQNIEVVTETTTKLINQKSVKAILEYLKYQYFNEEIYRYNFFALADLQIAPLKKVDFNKIKILDIVKRVIDEYGLFSNDFNILRFLDVISKQSDIEALLFEYERLDASAAASELNGVRVLTVHKSKGLEFEHVIVMDRLKKAPAARDAIIYEYEGIDLKNIYLRIKGRDAVDKNYAKALSAEKSLVREDSLNALYVAFTRAKETLIVASKRKDSVFDILDLQPKAAGILNCRQKRDNKVKQSYKNLDYKPLYYGTQSDILALEKVKEDDIRSINFGVALHYMLEMLGSFEEKNISRATDMTINKYGHILQDYEIEDLRKRVEMLLKNESFLDLVDGECYREKAIKYKGNLRYIDLLVKKDSLWNIIDYKSSISYQDENMNQVSYYVKAIKEITGENANGYICYLQENGTKIVKV